MRTVRLLLLSAVLTGLVLCPTAEATFPGDNGRIVLSRIDDIRSPDGGSHSVLAYSRAGRARRLLQCNSSMTNRCRGAESPSYSPDGTRIAYSTIDGLAIMDADGSNVRVLPRAGDDPAWSPGGRWLVFSRAPAPGAAPELYRARSRDGRGLQRLTRGGGSAPDWSVRRRIAYTRCPDPTGKQECAVRTMRADGRGDRALLKRASDPSWSPDGRRLAVTRYRPPGGGPYEEGDESRIWTMDADGEARERIFAESGFDPAWSPDGRKIVFGSRSQIDFEVALSVIDADGGDPKVVTTDPNVDGGFTSGPDWQPLPRR